LCIAYDVVSEARISAPLFSRRFPAQLATAVTRAVAKAPVVYLGLLAMGIGLASYVLFVVRGTWQHTYYGGSLWFTLLTDARIFLHYVKLLFFPYTLNADYSYNAFPVTTSWTDLNALAAVFVLGGLIGWLLSLLRSRPLATFGGLWFFLALLPVAHIIPHHEMMAEHYLYIPSVGFCLCAGALLDPVVRRGVFRRALYAGAGVVLALLALRTVWRNRDWKDDLTLWTKTVQTAPQAARARNNLGVAYLRRGRLAPAQEQLEVAIRIKPDHPFAHGNLGKVHFDRGDLGSAERQLLTALRLKPDEMIPRLWLAGVYAQAGRSAEAEQGFRAVLARDPRNAYAHNNLGILLARTGRIEEAEREFLEAVRLNSKLREAQENLNRLYLLKGRSTQAERSGTR
jgi:Flp pilus assembly protein TadD